jgi:hypothetical protein
MMEIDYTKLSIEELERLYFLHIETFDFICDGDKNKVIFEKII